MSTPQPDAATDDTLAGIAAYAAAELAPLAAAIDRQGLYPREFLTGLGARGGFGAVSPATGVDPLRQLEVISEVGRHCGSTAFLSWCQSACAWYLAHAPQPEVRERYLPRVLAGELLAGSGMSNALKHLAGIEKIRLHARTDGDGYVVDGVLPWVSNLERGHLLLTAAATGDGDYVMLAIETQADGVSLHECPDFAGMEGTRTWNVRLTRTAVPAVQVVARPPQFAAFIRAIKPGLVLTQAGFGLGVIGACLDNLQRGTVVNSQVNALLADGADEVSAALEALRAQAVALAIQARDTPPPVLPVLRLRASVSEWALRASQSAMLHVGARGYLLRHSAQRHVREAVFVAIVTPALKHLRKEIRDLEQGAREAA